MIYSSSKNKKFTKDEVKALRAKILEDCGYYDLKKKHGKTRRQEFPNLKVESRIPLSNSVGNGFAVKTGANHPDAKQFPVQMVHKSGLSLLTKVDDLKYAGGKKS